MKFEIIGSLTEFEKLEQDWRALSASSDHRWNVFSGYDWHRAVLNTSWPIFTDDASKLAIVVGRRHGRVEVICPFVLTKRFAISKLSWIGDPVSQYGDVIAAPGEARTQLINAAMKYLARESGADLFVLERVREDSAISKALERTRNVVFGQQSAPFIDLARFQGFDEYFANFSRGRRKQHRRLWRKLEQIAPITFQTLSSGPEAEMRTHQALELKTRMLAEQGTFSRAFNNPGFKPFFMGLASGRLPGTGFQISCLLSGQTLIAAEIGFRNSHSYVAHVGCYESKFKQLAPGRLQIERTLKSCFSDSLERYDFLAPDDAYKKDWCTQAIKVADIALPLSNAGKLYCGMLQVGRPVTSFAKRVLPASMVRLAANK